MLHLKNLCVISLCANLSRAIKNQPNFLLILSVDDASEAKDETSIVKNKNKNRFSSKNSLYLLQFKIYFKAFF